MYGWLFSTKAVVGFSPLALTSPTRHQAVRLTAILRIPHFPWFTVVIAVVPIHLRPQIYGMPLYNQAQLRTCKGCC
jgi:hypothetical protein